MSAAFKLATLKCGALLCALGRPSRTWPVAALMTAEQRMAGALADAFLHSG